MELKRTLNLIDATAIGIGAIIGAGIFVVLGIAVGYAGPAVVISMVIAGIVALFSALSFAELGSAIPKEGGTYEFAYQLISPSVAFLSGCLWLFGQTVAGAAVSLGLASYFVAIFPFFPLKVVAVSAALLLTALNLIGTKHSAMINNILVLIKIVILCLFIGFGVFQVNPTNYSQFAPNGFAGILQGAGFIFFAYLGFGRIAALGGEVKNPKRNLPLAILIALAISVVLYVMTGLVATGLQDYRILAVSGSPLADAVKVTGNFTLIAAISFGALVATTSVLLTNLIGLSRVSFAMANNGQLPKSMSKIHAKLGTPYISILAMGALMTILASVSDLWQTAAITSISILSTHIILHFSVVRLRKRTPDLKTFKAPLYPLIPALGIVSCIILMFSLPIEAWIVWVGFVTAVSVYYLLRKRF
ncbi:amino acid permease [Candidatus Bathyarchaeota archaeon]|nr:amino acid permease [Candidatus Bathyarchaeota archaeon]